MAVKKPASKSTLKRKVAVSPVQRRRVAKKSAKKRIIAKPIKTKKLIAKKLSYKKTPIKRKSTTKKVKLSKPFGITVMLGGVAALILLFTFGLPAILNPDTAKKPVLGVTVNGAPVNPAFTDPNFYACVIDNLNTTVVDGKSDRTYTYYAIDSELAILKYLECNGNNKTDGQKIANTKGLEKLTALRYIDLNNNRLTSIDVTKNTDLTSLSLYKNQLTYIDVSKNIGLEYLFMSRNKLTSIDVSKNIALNYLDLVENQLTSIDVTKNTALTSLYLSYNHNYQPATIDLSNNIALENLHLNNINLTSIDLSKHTALISLELTNNSLSSIDVSKNTALRYLHLNNVDISSIDLTKNTALETLDIGNNAISSIDLTKNTSLVDLNLTNVPANIVKAITSTAHSISSDHKFINTNTLDYAEFMAGVMPVNSLITVGVYRNGSLVQSSKLLVGDVLRVKIKDYTKYFDYTIRSVLFPTIFSYGSLASSINTASSILYRKPLSFVKSVDTNQITVKGNAKITSIYMANKNGNQKISKYAILVNGDKLVIKLSDGTKKEFVVKTAWRW